MSEPAALNATRFRAAHAGEWDRLDRLVTRLEKRSVRALSDDDLLALPGLYRTTLSSLSVARATTLDRALVTYLEALSTRAYFQLYGVQTSAWVQLWRFLSHGWPAAARALGRETVAAALLGVLGAVVGYLVVRHDPAWYEPIMGSMAQGRGPEASVSQLRDTLYHGDKTGLAGFATWLFSHNAQIAILSFALGFAFCVPTVLLLLYNGLMLGAFVAVFAAKGLGPNVGGWLAIHGTTELFAITLAGAGGLRIGLAVGFPGHRARVDSATRAGRQAAVLMAGSVAMLGVAGVLEGIGRQTVTGDAARWGIGLLMLAGWLVFLYRPRRTP